MSARSRNFYQGDDEFNVAVEMLNALSDIYRPFQWTTANKEHVDEFGDKIDRGDSYFKRELGGGFGNVLKLSARSMEILCGCLFFNNRQLTAVAEKMVKQRVEELADVQGRMSRLLAGEPEPPKGEK